MKTFFKALALFVPLNVFAAVGGWMEGVTAVDPNNLSTSGITIANTGCVNIKDAGGTAIGVLCLDSSDDLNIGDSSGVDNMNFDIATSGSFDFQINTASKLILGASLLDGSGIDFQIDNTQSYTIKDFGGSKIDILTLDASDDLKIGDATGINSIDFEAALDYNYLMNPVGAIVITGLGRMIDTGTMRFEQSPSIENTRAVTINVNANSQPSTHAFVVNFVATGLAAGETGHAFALVLDKNTSTGGVVQGLLISQAGAGSATTEALHVNLGVNVLHQEVGTLGNLEQVHTESDGFFTDITAASASTGTDATMFALDNDALYMGDAGVFDALEFNLETVASVTIIPVFEFSNGSGGWTAFSPTDETMGMRQTGDVTWEISDLSGWATDPTPPGFGAVSFDSGTTGTVTGITVDSVQIMSGSEAFDTDLATTAENVVTNIQTHTSSPNYTAFISSSTTVIIQPIATGTGPNGFVVASSNTGNMSLSDTNVEGGTADKFQIRITRTANTLVTPPVEDTIQIAATTEYLWTKDADIVINGIETIGSDGSFSGDVCGTSPAITGSDTAGKITVGSTTTTSCELTFSTAYSNAPACVVAGDNSAVTYAATSTTAILTVTSSADMAADVISFVCIGL